MADGFRSSGNDTSLRGVYSPALLVPVAGSFVEQAHTKQGSRLDKGRQLQFREERWEAGGEVEEEHL